MEEVWGSNPHSSTHSLNTRDAWRKGIHLPQLPNVRGASAIGNRTEGIVLAALLEAVGLVLLDRPAGPGLLALLAKIEDPRHRQGVRHRLVVILPLAVCAVLAGCGRPGFAPRRRRTHPATLRSCAP
jgi:hypothetical protein